MSKHESRLSESIIQAGFGIVDRLGIKRRLPKQYMAIYYRMSALHGSLAADIKTREWFAKLVVGSIGLSVGALLLYGLTGGDEMVLVLPLILLLIVPLLMVRDVDNKIRQKKMSIQMDLPLVLNQLVLLINAGETVQQALERIVSRQTDTLDRPLYRELQIAMEKLKNRVSFARVMEEMSQQCGVQDVSVWVNVILLNYRRGGEDLVQALSTLSHNMWESRKNTARTLGEEASSKLLFPMMIIFIVVLVVVTAPAIMMMNGP